MAVVPNFVIQQLAAGAVIPGALPLIGAAAPNLDSDVIKQSRERTWTYKLIDSGSGGLFESPVNLSNDYTQQLARQSPKYRTREALAKIDAPDRIGYSVRRVKFSGAGTTAITGSVINPYLETASETDELLTVDQTPDGSIKEFTADLANGNVMYETFSVVARGGKSATGEAMTPSPAFNGAATAFTFPALANAPIIPGSLAITTSAGVGTENFVDNGDGTLTGGAGGSGTIDYTTGVVGLTYFAAPAGGLTVAGDYGHSESFNVTLRDRGNGKLSFIDANGSWLDSGTIDYRIHPKTGAGSVRMRFQTTPPVGTTFVAEYDRGATIGTYKFLDTALITSIDPANFDVGIPVTGSNQVVVPPHWSLEFKSVGALAAVGSLGVMYGVGYGQRGGHETPGFGLQL